MFFNSIDFAIFLPIVFLLYWFGTKNNFKFQNLLLVISSYIFYAWWDWRFLSLIVFSSFVDFLIGIELSKAKIEQKRKVLLWTSILVNIGFLGFFKYFNFFLESFTQAFSFFGHSIESSSLHIVLPVGISFYTFQTLSYTIDVYKKKLKPTRNPVAFFAFVSFFPQLVAGPIERATNLLPQFFKKRTFIYDHATDGMRQILWGLFKKVVIADNAAVFVNQIFNNYESYSGSTLFLGAVFFAFQIYGDFSGYSDIAIGTSRLFGFNLKQNFAFPYFSRDIAEFWRRWHISLSTWFRDYLYIPLGGSKGGMWMKIKNTLIIFVVSGFWHGANWTFIIWGLLNALYFIPLLLSSKNRRFTRIVAEGSFFPSIKEIFQILVTFIITVIAWVFFRSDNVTIAFSIISEIFSKSIFDIPYFINISTSFKTIYLILAFLIIEWIGREGQYALEGLKKLKSTSLRWSVYLILVFVIYFYGNFSENIEFIYFQF